MPVKFTRLKINALEMLRLLGITAITVISLARYYLFPSITIIKPQKIKSYLPVQ
jgi:hypothetical protein